MNYNFGKNVTSTSCRLDKKSPTSFFHHRLLFWMLPDEAEDSNIDSFNDSKENAAFTFFTFCEAQSGIKTHKKAKESKMKNVKVNDFGLCIFTAHEKKQICIFSHFFCKFPNFRGKMKTSETHQRHLVVKITVLSQKNNSVKGS